VQPPAPPAAPVLAHRVPQLHALVELARTRGGQATARLELHPADLGRVDVVLRQSPDGLTAVLTAHDPAAVAVLDQAAADLRTALADRGVTVARVDVEAQAAGRGHDGHGRHAHGHHDHGRRPHLLTDPDPDPDVTVVPVALAPGALVDVRA
jgi:hypothetical protein